MGASPMQLAAQRLFVAKYERLAAANKSGAAPMPREERFLGTL